MKTVDRIAEIALKVQDDTAKFEADGNDSAAARARKGLLEIRKLAGEARLEIQAKRK